VSNIDDPCYRLLVDRIIVREVAGHYHIMRIWWAPVICRWYAKIHVERLGDFCIRDKYDLATLLEEISHGSF